LRYLLGDDYNSNLSYFKWKYHDNPYTEYPLGIVALYQGEIVGFRGYLATNWIASDQKNITILFPGDTCVNPRHRMKGLSVLMGNKAMEEFTENNKILLNMSSTKDSLPGYLKMGFFPLAKKQYMSRYNILGLIRFLLTVKQIKSLDQGKIKFGKYKNILISALPRPEEMCSVVSSRKYADGKIALIQDEKFFRWRFNNRKKKYVFYYNYKNNRMTGYLVMGVSPNNRRGYILDFAENNDRSIAELLTHIIKMKHYDVLSIYHFSVNGDIAPSLKSLDFRPDGLLRIIEKRVKGEIPLLVRPLKHEYNEKDLIINRLDIRNPDTWHIKGICSDDV
jgi:hypothetical protein